MTVTPDIVVIMSDQHAARVTGCYGDRNASTPNIDRLSREGVTFDNAYCPSPLCLPSRMSFMTGRYPARSGCLGNRSFLASDMPTFAHGLSKQGYRTCLAGRMHFVGPDQNHGFDQHLVGDINAKWPFGPLPADLHHQSGPGQTSLQAFDRTVATAAIAWLENQIERRRTGDTTPFCLVVGFFLPHPPFVAESDSYHTFYGRLPPPAQPRPDAFHPYVDDLSRRTNLTGKPPQEVECRRAAYYAMVKDTDRLVGEVVSVVDRNAEIAGSVVVYASDHGEQLGERDLWQKSLMYETSTRVPLIVRCPAHFPQGARRTHNVSLLDLGPTFLDLAGADPLPHADGRSLRTISRDPSATWDNRVFSEFYGGMIAADVPRLPVRMIRRDGWKLTWYYGYEPELFNLDGDPDETRNLAGDSAYQKVREELVAELLASWNPDAIIERIADEETREGYLKPWYLRNPDNTVPSWREHIDAES